MPHVFISYSRADLSFAQRVQVALEQTGYKTWLDTSSIPGGDEWIERITAGINEAFAVITLVSEAANRSKWVRREYLYADDKKKPVLPVIIDSSPFPLYMMEKQALRYTGEFDLLFENIHAALNHWRTVAPAPSIVAPAIGNTDQKPSAYAEARLRYLDRLLIKHSIWLEQYTPMAGVGELLNDAAEFAFRTADTEIEQEFETFLQRELPYSRTAARQEYSDVADAIAHVSPQRLVILGEPGAGKTTTLWRLVVEYASAARADARAPIPVFVPLGSYDRDIPLEDYVREVCGSLLSDLADSLSDLIEANEIVLLLDGLNEIPRNAIQDRVAKIRSLLDQHPELSVVVSCRELDYADLGLGKVYIKPLDPIRIRAFVQNYIAESGAGDRMFWELAGERAQDFWVRFEHFGVSESQFWLQRERPSEMTWHPGWQEWVQYRDHPRGMLSLARNPFMLYMMAKVYAKQGVVPANRAQLFNLFVNFLITQELNRSYSAQHDSASLDSIVRCLSEIAFQMQLTGGQGTVIDEVTALRYIAGAEPEVDGRAILYIARSANLLSLGAELQFTHQLLQEYFAANRLDTVRKRGTLSSVFWAPSNWWSDHQWDETAVLLTGLYSTNPSEIVAWIAQANPELAARCATLGGVSAGHQLLSPFLPAWIANIQDESVPVHARAGIARGLAQVDGDHRLGLGMPQDGIAAFAWCQPIHHNGFTLRFSRYLITNAQFNTFVTADREGYNDTRYWPVAGHKWKGARTHPDQYGVYPFHLANHPCTNVRWYEAVAFTNWLSHKLKAQVRLPTETEWIAATTGSPPTVFSYGNEFDPARANTAETGLGTTTAVGLFPSDVSPCGLYDIAGNAREWCLNSYDRLGESANEVDTNAVGQADFRAVRGGAFDQDMWFARTGNRNFRSPSDALRNIGFRVVMAD